MKIGVIGLGLIGGSILKSLSGKNFDVAAVSKSSYQKALEFTPLASENLEILKSCEIIFVCTPMKDTNEILKKLNGIISEDTLVADVSSVKNYLQTDGLRYNFISSHPMAGKETSGFEASDADIFKGCVWIIEKNSEKLEELIKMMGAKPYICNDILHDNATALISHLPLISSIALFNIARKNKTALALASSGFRDTTRLAAGSVQMSADILKYNSKNIDEAINQLCFELNNLKKLPENEKIELLREICTQRREMYDENGKNRTNI